MNEAKTKGKPGRPSRTLDQEIAAAEERVRALKEKKREDERRALERNQKAIVYLLRTELLDEIPIANWKAAVPRIRGLLMRIEVQPPGTGEPDAGREPPTDPRSAVLRVEQATLGRRTSGGAA
jgi:hypothetical protein